MVYLCGMKKAHWQEAISRVLMAIYCFIFRFTNIDLCLFFRITVHYLLSCRRMNKLNRTSWGSFICYCVQRCLKTLRIIRLRLSQTLKVNQVVYRRTASQWLEPPKGQNVINSNGKQRKVIEKQKPTGTCISLKEPFEN